MFLAIRVTDGKLSSAIFCPNKTSTCTTTFSSICVFSVDRRHVTFTTMVCLAKVWDRKFSFGSFGPAHESKPAVTVFHIPFMLTEALIIKFVALRKTSPFNKAIAFPLLVTILCCTITEYKVSQSLSIDSLDLACSVVKTSFKICLGNIFSCTVHENVLKEFLTAPQPNSATVTLATHSSFDYSTAR